MKSVEAGIGVRFFVVGLPNRQLRRGGQGIDSLLPVVAIALVAGAVAQLLRAQDVVAEADLRHGPQRGVVAGVDEFVEFGEEQLDTGGVDHEQFHDQMEKAAGVGASGA